MNSHTPHSFSEAQMVNLVRNALLVAGTEMGEEGDHWPVIKSTIHDIMLDYENLKIERAVHAEMKKHLYAQLEEMERILPTCTDEVKADVTPHIKELRDIYDAFFTSTDESKIILNDDDVPMHVKRAESIIGMLDGGDDE